MNLSSLFRNYLIKQSSAISANTLKNYLADVDHFLKWFQDAYSFPLTPENLTSDKVMLFKQYLSQKNYSGATIERHISSLRKFFQFAKESGLTTENTLIPKKVPNAIDIYQIQSFKNYLYEQGKEPNTIKNYILDLEHFFGWLDKVHNDYTVMPKDRVTKANISEYANRLLNFLHLSPSTVNRKLSSLRQYCKFAVEKGILLTDPFLFIIMPAPLKEVADKSTSLSDNLGNHPSPFTLHPSPSSYSSFPPLRLFQKIYRGSDHLLITTLIAPTAQAYLNASKFINRNQNRSKITYQKTLAPNKHKALFYGSISKPSFILNWDPKIVAALAGVAFVLASFGGILAYDKFFKTNTTPDTNQLSDSGDQKDDVFELSARLTDDDGNPITGKTLVLFSFYPDSESFADLLYQEAVEITPDAEGYFTVSLPDVPKSIIASSDPVYLGIAVQGDGEMRPRKLVSGTEVAKNDLLFDDEGKLVFSNGNPIFVAESGSFTLSGEQLILQTSESSDGSVVLWPQGAGTIDLLGPIRNSIAGLLSFEDAIAINAKDGTDPLTVSIGGTTIFTLDSLGLLTANGGTFSGNLLPSADSTYDLGTSVRSWKNIYADNVFAGSSGTQGFWQRNSGALSPANITDDLLIGSIATSSAKFRVAGTNGNITTSGDLALNGGDITSSSDITVSPDSGKSVRLSLANEGDFIVNAGQFYIDTSTGNIGIGVSSPGANLQIQGNAVIGYGASTVIGPTGGLAVSGNVGIGTSSPTSALQVAGRVRLDATTGSSTNGLCWSGDVGDAQIEDCSSTPGDIAESYGTLDETIEAGDVVAIDPITYAVEIEKDGRKGSKAWIEKTSTPYQSTAIGVVSTDPNMVIGENFDSGENPRPVALVGRVPIKVSLENGPIAIGDFLTTSSTPGIAMKATKTGTVIGKSLQSFSCNQTTDYGLLTAVDGSQSTVDGSCQGKILIFINISWYDPAVMITDTGKLVIKEATYAGLLKLSTDDSPQTTAFELVKTAVDGSQSTVDKISAFSNLVVANLRAGFIETKQLTTDSLAITTDNITISGQTIKQYIEDIVSDSMAKGNIASPLATADIVKTNMLSPLSTDTIIVDGHLVIASEVASDATNAAISNQVALEVRGNASISGTITADNGQFNNITIQQFNNNGDATISGTLTADTIVSGTITDLQTKISSMTSSLLSSVAQMNDIKSQLATQSAELTNNTLYAEASTSGELRLDRLFASQGSFLEGLLSFGPSGFSDVSISGIVSLGNTTIMHDNTINVLGSDLKLQNLGQGGVSIADGRVYIDSMGNLAATSITTQDLTTQTISPPADENLIIKLGSQETQETNGTNASGPSGSSVSSGSSLIVQDASGSAVVNISSQGDLTASGSATFGKLQLPQLIKQVTADGQTIESTGTVGKGVIVSGTYEITIETPYITKDSLIYISPTSDTGGFVPYLARQIPGKSFTIAIADWLEKDITFNWWIIN